MKLSVIRELKTINEILNSDSGDRIEEAMQMIREASTGSSPLTAEESTAMNGAMLELAQKQSALTPLDDRSVAAVLSERYPVSEMPQSEKELTNLQASIYGELEDPKLTDDKRQDRLDHLVAVNIALNDLERATEPEPDYLGESSRIGSGTDIRQTREQKLRNDFDDMEGRRLSEQTLKQYNDSVTNKEARYRAYREEQGNAASH